MMQNRSGRVANLDRPLIMGILNVTPDSFSDGGRFFSADRAIQHASQMIAEGADIVDIGGESTRPSAAPVSLQQELDRVLPVIQRLRRESDVLISVDTQKPEVMREALRAGADIVNDVSALAQPGAIGVVTEFRPIVCLMHMRGTPQTMQSAPHYNDVVSEVKSYLLDRAWIVEKAGLERNHIWLDPGFGFGKTQQHNWQLFRQLGDFVETGYPILVGVSRKSMVGHALKTVAEDRLIGSVAAAAIAALNGAKILRVHDVKETRQALQIVAATLNAGEV